MIEKGIIQKRLKELEEDYSKEVFNRVAFITFNKQNEAEIYEKLYPSKFILINLCGSFI